MCEESASKTPFGISKGRSLDLLLIQLLFKTFDSISSTMKALRSLFWVITAQSYFLFSQAGAIDNEASPIFQSWGDVLSPASHPDIDSWKARRQIASISSINGTSNSTLSATERIVKEAQEEARIRNKFLVEHPRKNNYAFRNFPIANNKDNATGTGVNKSVSDAAALITDYLSRNGSVKPTLAERQTSSYWMENINQNYGKSPYVSNQTYKVSLKKFVDHKHFYFAFADKIR